MNAMAKKGRDALKAKARKMAMGDNQKVDSSNWTPAPAMNADAKTGMRPVSRRAYKTGGKVMGEDCAPRMDRKPRATGGKADKKEAKDIAIAKMNRNQKTANEEREGVKHIGGMKTGGRAAKADGGRSAEKKYVNIGGARVEDTPEAKLSHVQKAFPNVKKITPEGNPIFDVKKRKTGGRAKKADGGDVEQLNSMSSAAMRRGVEAGTKTPTQMPKNPPMPPKRPTEPVGKAGSETIGYDKGQNERIERGYKKGGKAHEAGGRTKKDVGGALMGGVLPAALMGGMGDKDKKAPMKKGGRAERKAGGRVGKTNINIVIATKPQGGPDGTVTAPAAMRPPGGMPVPVQPPSGAGGPPMPMPVPMPMPMGGPPQGMPPGMPPMARKAGGRVFRSYKDMKAGAGSGEGRLEKTEIQKNKR